MCIRVSLSNWRKSGDIQSNFEGETICRREEGKGVGIRDTWDVLREIVVSRQHVGRGVSRTRYVFGYNLDVKGSSKNQRHLRRCITMASLEEPLLIASTTL